jgi:hypothetical protein
MIDIFLCAIDDADVYEFEQSTCEDAALTEGFAVSWRNQSHERSFFPELTCQE